MRKKPAVGQTAGKSAEKRGFLKSPENSGFCLRFRRRQWIHKVT